MALGIDITGATTEQKQRIAAAFAATISGKPEAMSNARWAELCVIRFIKSVLKSQARESQSAAIDAAVAQVDADFEE